MTRRFLIPFQALMTGMVLTTVAGGQTGANQSLAERMAALRRGWTAPAPQAEATDQDEPTAIIERGQGQPYSGRTTAQPRAGSVQSVPTRTSNPHLPGLGGSPLPQDNWTAAGRNNNANNISRDPNYPVIRDVTREKPTTQQQPAGPHAQSATQPTRHSPDRRPSTHYDDLNLQRELAGSFPSNDNGPVARTAQAENREQRDGKIVEEPLVLAPLESATPVASQSSASPQTSQSRPSASTTPTDQSAAAAAEAFGITNGNVSPSTQGTMGFTRSPRLNPIPASDESARRKDAFGEALHAANGGDPNVLVSHQAPVIATDIRGPKQIVMGREAVYRVRMQNQGTAAAEGVVATVRIPSWADIVGTVATKGNLQPAQQATTQTLLEWHLPRVDSNATETLDLRLVPRESRPLELSISWTAAPVGSRAIVEVQEPKLNIEINGPNEVFFAKPQVFRLTLSNPGTGPAENVKIDLVPPGKTQESVSSHTLGNLYPGDSKTVEIELTPREAGKLQVKAIASAEGGLNSDAIKEVFCRKPELELDWRGPATQYSGTTATYFFRVRNPGTAAAEGVTVQVSLPEGVEFASASEGQSFDAQKRQVAWRIGSLAPGDDSYMELKCVVKKPGANRFQLSAVSSSPDLTDNATAETNVIALADLKLQVTDPTGAVAVGAPALYEIQITNRGASAAKDVLVIGLFSDGIEPDHAEGASFTISDGRVSFRAIEELPAGGNITLRIRAHAVQPGTHVFRAEVSCSDAEIKLAAEETTRFYSEDVQPEADGTEQSAGRYGFDVNVR